MVPHDPPVRDLHEPVAALRQPRVVVPLLELYALLPAGDALFVEAVRGLLLEDPDAEVEGA